MKDGQADMRRYQMIAARRAIWLHWIGGGGE